MRVFGCHLEESGIDPGLEAGKLFSDTFPVSGGEDRVMSCGLRAIRASEVIAVIEVASRSGDWI